MQLTVERDAAVPTRDGTVLRADVYRPADDRPRPALVQRTPYGKSETRNLGGMVFRLFDALERGYVVVVQDVRGRARSEGTWTPFVHEAADGFDTIEWVAEQPWCDGHVSISGASYLGVAALAAATAAPPHLCSVIAYLAGGDLHDGWVYTGGALELADKLKWVASLARDTLRRSDLDPARREAIARQLDELSAHPARVAARLPVRDALPGAADVAPYWHEWLDHPHYDPYWQAVDLVAHAARIRVPVLHIAGWYDAFLHGHLQLEQALRTTGPPDLRTRHRFVIGPWDHESYLSIRPANAGVRNFGPAATSGPAGLGELALGWFDTWMAPGFASDSAPRPADALGRDAAPVAYFAMGPDTWQTTRCWPPPDAQPRHYLLRSGGHANSRSGDGRLVPAPLVPAPAATSPAPGRETTTGAAANDAAPAGASSPDAPSDAYVYDPADPVPTCGGRFNAYGVGPGGVQDQRHLEDRADVLVYTSAPLADDLTVTGNVTVSLWVSTDAPDTDFTAKLVDVDPDGGAWNVAEGITRCRYRHGPRAEDTAPMPAGEPTLVRIDLWDTAYRFGAGHAVRLEVASSNFPRFDRHPNRDLPLAEVTDGDLRPARQVVHHDPDHPSTLTLAIMPSSDERRVRDTLAAAGIHPDAGEVSALARLAPRIRERAASLHLPEAAHLDPALVFAPDRLAGFAGDADAGEPEP